MLHGTWFVVPTPFKKDGTIDLDSQQRLVDAAVGWRVDGLTVMGVTSESHTLTSNERAALLQSDWVAGY